MNKTELETIAMDCLDRLETESKAARQSQDEKIRTLENRVSDFEQQLTRLSGLYRRLETLAERLKGSLIDNKR